jgi:CubicO group peptidase (beta-lactamase class C family)
MSILLLGVSLDTEVHAFIPDLKSVIPNITIRQLLHHISGIRDQWVLATLAGWRMSDDVISRTDVVKDFVPRMKTLNFSPGAYYSYSNTNYTLAGEIVKKVSGLSLAKFADDNIFQPLSMRSTRITETHGEIIKNRAYGYRGTHPKFELRMPNYDLTGPTNLLTTVEDLLRWDRNFDMKTVGGSAALIAMQTTLPPADEYGLGLFIRNEDGRQIVEHDGRDAGYRSHLIRYPDDQLAVALLGNLAVNDIWTGTLVREVAAIFLNSAPSAGPPIPALPPQTTFSPANLTEYVGRYYSDEADTFYEIVLSGSSIAITRRKYDATPLYPTSHDNFNMDQSFSNVLTLGALQFSRDKMGEINGFRIDDINPDPLNRLRNFRFTKLP